MTDFSEADVESLENCQLDLDRDIGDWLEALKKADRLFHNMMTVEIWSIAQTMDELNPGFWSQYMQNRQVIVQQQIKERKFIPPRETIRSHRKPLATRRPSPIELSIEKAAENAAAERVSLFSKDLEANLPKLTRSLRPSASTLRPSDLPSVSDSVLEFRQQSNSLETVAEEVVTGIHIELPQKTDVDVFSQLTEAGTTQAQTTQAQTTESTISTRSVASAISANSVTLLPHLIRSPTTRVLPFPTDHLEKQGLVLVAISCWLTRCFLVLDPETKPPTAILRRWNEFTLAPRQSIICRLGFELVDPPPDVKVQLVKSLRLYPGLVAEWMSRQEIIQLQLPDDLSPSEISIRLINQSHQPCYLQAGQLFCRLEFTCPISSLPTQRYKEASKKAAIDAMVTSIQHILENQKE